jgi:hypothetical protein
MLRAAAKSLPHGAMAPDEDPVPDADAAEPPALPALYASPAGCGAVGALVFALLTGPPVLLAMGYGAECFAGAGCAPAPGAMLALVAAVAAGYGYLVWELVTRRAETLAAGGSNRPPLWAALIGLTLLGMMVVPLLLPLLVAALAG